MPKTFLIVLVLGLILFGCRKDREPEKDTLLPSNFETPPEVLYPGDNAYSLKRWELGKKLFFDPVLSSDSSISCGSCHKQSLAFADDLAKSPGVFNRPGNRNVPTLTNIAYHPYFTREGGVPTLEMQVQVPLQEHNEMDLNIVAAGERLKQIKEYVSLSKEAYNREPDYFVITRAIALFERGLISKDSPFDQYAYQDKPEAMSEDQKAGLALFFSEKTNCTKCHSGFNFTNYSFQNNGLYTVYADSGRQRLTRKESDRALFKVPSLRNVSLTPPYMHDGSFQTLEEVIDHYDSGGKNHPHQSDYIRPLHLSQKEKKQLVEFLESLSDYTFINNPKFQ